MDTNAFQIVQLLLAEDRFVTYQHLAKEIDVSTRTINRIIKHVQDYLNEHTIPYSIQTGKGIKIELSEKERQEAKTKLQNENIEFIASEERKLIILCHLFKESDYLKMNYLASKLKLSLGTVDRTLQQVEEWLNSYQLYLERERGKGIKIHGTDMGKIRGMAEIITQNIEMSCIHTNNRPFVTLDTFDKKLTGQTRELLISLVDFSLATEVKDLIESFDDDIKSIFVDESYFNFVLVLTFIIESKQKKDKIISDNAKEGMEEQSEAFQYIKQLILQTERYFKIKIYQEEQDLLLGLYLSARRQGNTENTLKSTDSYTLNMAVILIGYIEEELGIHFNYQSDLLKRLMIHLRSFINRSHLMMEGSNQYLDLIKKDYFGTFEAVRKSLLKLGNVIPQPVSESQIGFITMHVVATMMEMNNNQSKIKVSVVCMSGMGTSKILIETLKQKFPQLDILGALTIDEVDEITLVNNKVDLLISSVQLETSLIPTILVNPFLPTSDLRRIQELLDTINTRKSISYKSDISLQLNVNTKQIFLSYMDTIYKLINHFHYQADLSVSSISELIKYVASIVTDNFIKQQRLIKKLKKRERYGSSLVDSKGVILIHARIDDLLYLGVIHVNGLTYQTEEGLINIKSVIIMMAPEEKDDIVMNLFGNISTQLVQDQDLMHVIRNGDENTIITTFGKKMIATI
ncbi:PRD domain-containing protein [Oceanobacillus jeddahense]|uniref:PRD domain-containing protein n=1 Tax=Oceanobacillus jeddahense TaxID=1462527 RepID=UPI0036321E67